MKLLVDMNLSPRWTDTIINAGFEAEHWSRVGRPTASDAEIMAFARAKNFVVLTHDLDFGAILAVSRGEKPSVVQIRSDNVSPDVIAPSVISFLRQMAPQLEAGALLTVHPSRARLILLPLGGGE